MAKKIVRGITDVKTINNQDFDTNNVNDLLSDGQYNYIHRKKGKNEEYHNLTDNLKTISSDNTELLSVTNNNKTTNTATLHPKHDAQKEQVLESTRNTITINHGTNGTAEKTTVDTNPLKVLEHEKLKTGDGLTTSFNTDETTIMFKATKKAPQTDLNSLGEGIIRGNNFPIDQVPGGNQDNSAVYITLNTTENTKIQLYIRESQVTGGKIVSAYRFIKDGAPTPWKTMTVDNEELLSLLAQKQNKLTAGTGITIQGNTISATGSGAPIEGASVSIQDFSTYDFLAYKHTITQAVPSGQQTLTTFTFQCLPQTAEIVLTGELKAQFGKFLDSGSISNGAITISNDGTSIKVTNSKSTENVYQQGTFTFYEETGGGGDNPM